MWRKTTSNITNAITHHVRCCPRFVTLDAIKHASTCQERSPNPEAQPPLGSALLFKLAPGVIPQALPGVEYAFLLVGHRSPLLLICTQILVQELIQKFV
jgi:hypothetical protein